MSSISPDRRSRPGLGTVVALALVMLGLTAVSGEHQRAAASVATTAVYWTNYSANTLSVTNSASPGTLLSTATNPSLSNPRPLATDGTSLFIGDQGGNVMLRTDMSGAQVTTLSALNGLNISSMYANATHLYYTRWSGGVYRANKDGSGSVQLVTPSANGAPSSEFAGVFATADTVYFTYYASGGGVTGKIYRRSINVSGGTGSVGLVFDTVSLSAVTKRTVEGLTLVGEHLYSASSNGIVRVGLDGTGATVLGSGAYKSLTEADGWLYFTKSSEVGRMALDGTGQETVATASGMFGIATAPTFGVTYQAPDAMAGTAPVDGSSPYTTAATVTVLGNTGNLTRPGCALTGWNTRQDGTGVTYSPGSTFTMAAAAVTLHAQWSCQYPVTYLAAGATSGAPPIETSSPYTTAGTSVTVRANSGNLARHGYQFAGWELDHAGSVTSVTVGATFSISTPATLSARWIGGPLEFSATERGPTSSAFAFADVTVGTPVDLEVWVRNTGAIAVTLTTMSVQGLRTGDTTCPVSGGTVAPYDANAVITGACRLSYRWTPADLTPLSFVEHLGYGVTDVVTVSGQALATPLTPVYDTPAPTADGFTVNVTNWDNLWTWSSTTSAGAVTTGAAGGGVMAVTVSGLAPSATATLTVETARAGHAPGSATVAASARVAPTSTPVTPGSVPPATEAMTTQPNTTPDATSPPTTLPPTTRPPSTAPPTVPETTPEAPSVDPGTATIVRNGVRITVPVTPVVGPDGVTGLTMTHESLTLSATGVGGPPRWSSRPGVLTLRPGGLLDVRASGFTPSSIVRIVAYSIPRTLGEFTTDGDGQFSGRFELPRDLDPGGHTLVVRSGETEVALPLEVLEVERSPRLPATGRSVSLWQAWSMIAVGGALLTLRARRGVSIQR